ncbi:geranylgeranyl pyrophosphate synthase [Crotalus adamanteus]|uniref:Geranylgeranyl pyrophosphate synthase n=1 Tax=Crotalus adamanteus TaxID=8729 RepID=A0AAW1CDE5_CROAD
METETRLRSAFWVTWFCPAHLPQSMREFFFAATTAPEMPREGEEENEKMEGERDEEGFWKREEGRSSRLRQQAPSEAARGVAEAGEEAEEAATKALFWKHIFKMEELEDSSKRIFLEPYNYLLQLPGKQVRSKLSQAFNHWLNVPEDKLQIIIEVTEMLHNASLLIDDIEDNSKLRRGFPVAHSIYGIP